LVTLVAVASLVFLNQFLVQPPLLRLMTDAPVINVAGRQRMLSQRLTKAALALVRENDDADLRRYLAELERTLKLWSVSHDELKHGDKAKLLPGKNSEVVRAAFDDLEPFFTRMRDAAARMIRSYSGGRPGATMTARADLATILDTEADYLARMDRIVGLYEREARGRVDQLLWTGWAVTGLILVALVAIGLFILRPAARLIRRQILELREARDELEDRVQERTRELELANQELEERAQELARSNAELEQFAYVASHDLQEPLRMVTSYCQLLERRYKDKLDAQADKFITYAVDGASRMQGLIDDLLAYSRMGRKGDPFRPTDCSAVVDQAIANLQAAIRESAAVVIRDTLPTVIADSHQLTQVFQNLIGNAIKFRKKEEPPRVHISAAWKGNEWIFSVRDNGIGIVLEHRERIFQIFQRLHGRSEYPGTGIGLAICKKGVEHHGGRIWVESQPGIDSEFFFTIPKK
jgi:signal transduction histidine kinase